MSSLSLTNFPGEVHVLIGGFLKPSEMEGIIASSKYMREQYAKSFFHDVVFRGTAMDLVLNLIAFLHAKNNQQTTSDIVLLAIR
jgi:hypothetical protein